MVGTRRDRRHRFHLCFDLVCHEFELTVAIFLPQSASLVAALLGSLSDAANVFNGTAVLLRCSPYFQSRVRALYHRTRGSSRPRKWRCRGAVVPTCSPPFLCAQSCSARRADHLGSVIFFGVAGNEIPASSEELTSLAAMAPPCSASARRAPRLHSF